MRIHITVNQVAPGWIKSEKDTVGETHEHITYEQTVPLKRRGADIRK